MARHSARGPKGRFVKTESAKMRGREIGERVVDQIAEQAHFEQLRSKKMSRRKLMLLEKTFRKNATAFTISIDSHVDIPNRHISLHKQAIQAFDVREDVPYEDWRLPNTNLVRDFEYEGQRLREYRWRFSDRKYGMETIRALNELIGKRLYPKALATWFRIAALPSKRSAHVFKTQFSREQENGVRILFGTRMKDPIGTSAEFVTWVRGYKGGGIALEEHDKKGSYIIWELAMLVDVNAAESVPMATPPGATADKMPAIRINKEGKFGTRIDFEEKWTEKLTAARKQLEAKERKSRQRKQAQKKSFKKSSKSRGKPKSKERGTSPRSKKSKSKQRKR